MAKSTESSQSSPYRLYLPLADSRFGLASGDSVDVSLVAIDWPSFSDLLDSLPEPVLSDRLELDDHRGWV